MMVVAQEREEWLALMLVRLNVRFLLQRCQDITIVTRLLNERFPECA